MNNLTDYFARVYVLNCAHRPDRLSRVRDHLQESGMADIDKVIFYPAIVGDWVTSPAGWGAGRGAWGCLRSHMRIIEDVMQTRDANHEMTLSSVLILEDDVFFTDNALEELNHFMSKVPPDWDQIYLGGQHQRRPVPVGNGVSVGISVNRTHAYALAQKNFQAFYRHICFAPDYIGNKKHIDHQLETAHQRRDWNVYCPDKWICGQEAGSSNVSGKINERKLWD